VESIEKLNAADVSSIWNWSFHKRLCLNPNKSQAIITSLQPILTQNIWIGLTNGLRIALNS
jgi:hypothetical protein